MDSIFIFLSQIVFWGLSIYEWIIIIAILITWVNPDPSNPIVIFLNRMTQPFWKYLGTILPSSLSLFTPYISLLVVWFAKIFIPGSLISLGYYSVDKLSVSDLSFRVIGFFIQGIGVVLQNFLTFLLLLLIIWFFMTMISPSINNPIVRTVYFLVDPFITPLQKRLPRTRIDFSPLVASLIVFGINFVLVSSLIQFSLELTHTRSIPAISG